MVWEGRRVAAPVDQPRAIRVFVSSTFRDMRAEREELVGRVFPAIRRLCASRGVTFQRGRPPWAGSGSTFAADRLDPLPDSDGHGGGMAEEFEGRDLKGAGFWGVDLTGARFREANLTDVSVSHAWLVNVDIDASSTVW